MNNRFLLHGKCIDNGKWVEGYLIEQDDPEYHAYICMRGFKAEVDNRHQDILDCDLEEIIPETAGRCAGLIDKNSKRIFEGDICRNDGRTYLICWLDNKYAWGCLNLKTFRKTPIYDVISRYGNNFEVIGNKYDISELPQDINESVLKSTTSTPFQPVLKSDDEDFVNFELREG